MLTKDELEKHRAKLIEARDQASVRVMKLDGAIQNVEYLLGQIDGAAGDDPLAVSDSPEGGEE